MPLPPSSWGRAGLESRLPGPQCYPQALSGSWGHCSSRPDLAVIGSISYFEVFEMRWGWEWGWGMVVSEILGGAQTVSSEGKRKLGMSPERGQPCDRAGARPEALWERSATPGAVMCLSTAGVLFQVPAAAQALWSSWA